MHAAKKTRYITSGLYRIAYDLSEVNLKFFVTSIHLVCQHHEANHMTNIMTELAQYANI